MYRPPWAHHSNFHAPWVVIIISSTSSIFLALTGAKEIFVCPCVHSSLVCLKLSIFLAYTKEHSESIMDLERTYLENKQIALKGALWEQWNWCVILLQPRIFVLLLFLITFSCGTSLVTCLQTRWGSREQASSGFSPAMVTWVEEKVNQENIYDSINVKNI